MGSNVEREKLFKVILIYKHIYVLFQVLTFFQIFNPNLHSKFKDSLNLSLLKN
jgi:hypothetical protein